VADKQTGTGLSKVVVAAVSAARFLPSSGAIFRAAEKNLKFFEMSAQKNFRKEEPNRVNQPKLT
jgi:hypothetical protein